jgi:hypothetical protein
MQKRLFRATGNVDRGTPIRELYVVFKIPYVYDYVTKLYRAQAEVFLNHVNPNMLGIGQGVVMHRKYKRLKLGGGQDYDRSANCSLKVIK